MGVPNITFPKVKFKSTGRFRNICVAFSEHMNSKRWCNNRPTHNDTIDDIIVKVDLCVLCIFDMHDAELQMLLLCYLPLL